MATLTDRPGELISGLVDSDTFFERAARGERDAQPAVAPDRGQGAATMPRDPRPPTPRGVERSHAPARSPYRRLRVGAVTVAVGAFVVVALLVAAMSGGQPAPSRPASVTPPAAPRESFRSPLDALGPRLGRVVVGDGRVAGVAFDPGSGVRRVELVADGRRADADVAACRSECAPAAHFSLDAPAPDRDGLRSLAVVANDAAGNEALIWQRLIGSAEPHGETITARLEDRDGQLAPRSRYAISGRLTDRAGHPIAGAQVELVAVAATASATPTRVAVVIANRDGRWRVGGLRATNGSRLYVARHLDGTRTNSRPLRATVPVALTASARRLTSGRRIVTGRVTAAAPDSAIRLLLAARRSGAWHTERTTRARHGGRFELAVPERLHGRMAVFVAPDPDLPYAPAGRVVDLARP